jgi:hypothetical protein
VPVFELLLQQGCPLHELKGVEGLANLSCHDKYLPALQYCLNFSNMGVEGRNGWALLGSALINDQLKTAQWLKQQGAPWPPKLWLADSSNVHKLCSVRALEVRALHMLPLAAVVEEHYQKVCAAPPTPVVFHTFAYGMHISIACVLL